MGMLPCQLDPEIRMDFASEVNTKIVSALTFENRILDFLIPSLPEISNFVINLSSASRALSV